MERTAPEEVNQPSSQKYALKLAEEAASWQLDEEIPTDFPASLVEVLEIWNFETEGETSPDQGKYGLWRHSCNGGIDAVCEFIRHLLKKFNPAGRVELEWSNDCSKPRLDAY